jgi:hypothetical protein
MAVGATTVGGRDAGAAAVIEAVLIGGGGVVASLVPLLVDADAAEMGGLVVVFLRAWRAGRFWRAVCNLVCLVDVGAYPAVLFFCFFAGRMG